MTSFKGKFEHSIDDKGRISLPAKFRRNLGDPGMEVFTITRGMDKCLYLYTQERWSAMEEDLRTNLNPYKEEDRLFLRTLQYWTHEVQLDKQNRIMVPQELLDVAGITTQVLLIGALERIEIWSPQEFTGYMNRFAETPFEVVAARVMGGAQH